jgi:hypothetical protein
MTWAGARSRTIIPLVAMCWAAAGLASAQGVEPSPESPAAAPVPPPLVFEGFGLGAFEGSGSVASALRAADGGPAADDEPLGVPLDVVVKGPSGHDRLGDPLGAELRGGFQGLDLAAGFQADPAIVKDGPAKWTGAMRLSSARPDGRDLLELKTSLDRRSQEGVVRLELGPRIERRLRRGTVVFIDGKAQAQARRAAETGPWLLPGMAEGQGGGSVGVNASTGLTR